MGAHLVFFLHITTGPDNVNNVMALAFGVLIVLLVIAGSLLIMAHMNHNMMPMDQIMQMQRSTRPRLRLASMSVASWGDLPCSGVSPLLIGKSEGWWRV